MMARQWKNMEEKLKMRIREIELHKAQSEILS
jgi:hypothetical protein